MKSGFAIFIVTMIVLVAATFAPSIRANDVSRYRLVDSWVSGLKRICLYENSRGEQITKSISKGKSCRYIY